MRASYRDDHHQKRAGEDDDGGRDCVLAAFGLTVSEAKIQKIMYVPANQKVGGICRSPSIYLMISMQPARYTNKQSSLCTWAGLSLQTETSASK